VIQSYLFASRTADVGRIRFGVSVRPHRCVHFSLTSYNLLLKTTGEVFTQSLNSWRAANERGCLMPRRHKKISLGIYWQTVPSLTHKAHVGLSVEHCDGELVAVRKRKRFSSSMEVSHLYFSQVAILTSDTEGRTLKGLRHAVHAWRLEMDS
jgi:hypothetical protein